MKPRLLILVALAGGLAVWLAMRPAVSPKLPQQPGRMVAEGAPEDLVIKQQLLSERALPGDDPPEEAELSITVEVDPTLAKNRLYYYVSEAHGYYVETFRIEFYYKPDPSKPLDQDSVPVFEQYVNDYLPAGVTKKFCLEVTGPELCNMRGQVGRSENWEAEIIWYDRAREKNPDPLPPLSNVAKCD